MSGGVLVVGAREGSLGDAIAVVAQARGHRVLTAGIHDEQTPLDVVQMPMKALVQKLDALRPRHIVCTVGMNMPEPVQPEDVFDWYRWHYETNVIGPMRLLEAWYRALESPDYRLVPRGHYVAISSNSATIPRTGSAAYCSSKAALSMALRVKGREGTDKRVLVYGYEPGLLAGTPMTAKSREAFAGPLHRMKPQELVEGIEPAHLAGYLVANLAHHGSALNGHLIGYSADEL